jgi:hypothetical protein
MRMVPLILIVLVAGCAPRQDAPASSVASDRALVEALKTGDASSALGLVDDAVTWTDATGRTLIKSQMSEAFPTPAIANETADAAHAFDYGRVAVVRIDRGRMHTLRVWAQRPEGWRLLVYQEVESLASPPAPAPGIGHECVNPCKTLPYEPKTENERGVIAAYQALEIAAHAADVDNWGRYVADEFVVVSSNSDRVIDKASRLEGLRKAAYGGVSPSPLVSAELLDFDTAVVMRAQHQPETGNPLQIGRVWVTRNGSWMSVLSYQTAITGRDPTPSRTTF